MKGRDRIFRDMKEARRNFCNIECWNFLETKDAAGDFFLGTDAEAKPRLTATPLFSWILQNENLTLSLLNILAHLYSFWNMIFWPLLERANAWEGESRLTFTLLFPGPCFPGQHLLLTTEKVSLGREFFFHNWLEQHLMKNMIGTCDHSFFPRKPMASCISKDLFRKIFSIVTNRKVRLFKAYQVSNKWFNSVSLV